MSISQNLSETPSGENFYIHHVACGVYNNCFSFTKKLFLMFHILFFTIFKFLFSNIFKVKFEITLIVFFIAVTLPPYDEISE